ncbi:MAG: hypothetical protein ACQEV7_04720 [Bacillota bacterium]
MKTDSKGRFKLTAFEVENQYIEPAAIVGGFFLFEPIGQIALFY